MQRDATWSHRTFTGEFPESQFFLAELMSKPDVLEALKQEGADIGPPDEGGAMVRMPAGLPYWISSDELHYEIELHSGKILVIGDDQMFLAEPARA